MSPLSTSCAVARERIRACATPHALVAKTSEGSRRHAALREHLADCADCRAAYRTAIQAAAAVGRKHREEARAREAEDKRARRERTKRAALGATLPRVNRFGLRTLIYPAFFCWLMVWATRGGPLGPTVRAEWLGGEVRTSSGALDAEHAHGTAPPGSGYRTAEDGRVRLVWPEARIELQPDTALWVESVRHGRARLEQGTVRLEGDFSLTMPTACLVFEAAQADVHLERGMLRVTCEGGRVVYLSAHERRELGAGDAWTIQGTG